MIHWILSIFVLIGVHGIAMAEPDRDLIFQVSTIDALLAGVYDGNTTIGELQQYGDIAIGTFNGLDGEMIALDGNFYTIRVDGLVYAMTDEATLTPFAIVTYFHADQTLELDTVTSMSDLTTRLDAELPTTNHFYAFKITGTFDSLTTRSVPKQTQPYPPLLEVIQHQQEVFHLENITGTMVGFRCPSFAQGLNVVGYHFHFLADDLSTGGHVLDLHTAHLHATWNANTRFSMNLPESGPFLNLEFSKNTASVLEHVETHAK